MSGSARSLPRSRCRAWLAAALLLAVPVMPGALAAEEPDMLGRLFLSPAERRELDAHRGEAATADGDTALPRDLLPARTAAPERLVMNGLVRRQRGAPVVWVNGKPLEPGAAAGLDAQGTVTVRPAGQGRAVRLKPGQTWSATTGEVNDCVQCVLPTPVGGAQAPTDDAPVGGAQAPTDNAPVGGAQAPTPDAATGEAQAPTQAPPPASVAQSLPQRAP